MDVLHYSFSLSACPKCHLLVCQHTSLANLDFQAMEQSCPTASTRPPLRFADKSVKSPTYHGMNYYILPSMTPNNRYSWTTFGTNSAESTDTLENSSGENETCSENIPFADECLISSPSPVKSTFTHVVRTQSARCYNNAAPRICLTKSFSLSTIYTTPKSLPSSPHIEQAAQRSTTCYSDLSLLTLILLMASYLLTNTFDIVLLYIYYYMNYLDFVLFLCTLLAVDLLLWVNNLLDFRHLPTRFLLLPFVLRFYILYELVEVMIVRWSDKWMGQTQISQPPSTASSSTTTTLETNLSPPMNGFLIHSQSSASCQPIQRRLFSSLTLFYLIHSSLLVLVNLYFWSNDFQLTTHSHLRMDYFVPQWITEDELSILPSPPLIGVPPSLQLWPLTPDSSAEATMLFNWTGPLFYRAIPLGIRFATSSTVILISIFYHLLVNYSFLSTILTLRPISWTVLLSILSRLFLIVTRIYTLIFLIRLHAWWFTLIFFTVHLTLMVTLLFEQHRHGIVLELIFSLLTQSSTNEIAVHALISLENISIFLHRLYLETFALPNETTLRFIVFISILISLQIIGFLFSILWKHILDRTRTEKNTITQL